MSEQTTPDKWSEAELKRGGFDADGKRTQSSVKEAGEPQFLLSPDFTNWLKSTGGSLVLSTYQSGRIIFLGINQNDQVYSIDRAVGTAMGIAIDQDKLWVGTREQIWRFSNVGPVTINDLHYEAVYMPRTGHMVGTSNTHDVLADVSFRGQHYDFLYANTQYSCISALDNHHSFVPIWKPDFISDLQPEDRCHLNGIGARDGELRYASFCGRTDEPLLWKEKQTGTGFIMDLKTEEVVCEGLSMPHSPRWHDGKLWVLNSGEGELGYVDFENKRFIPVANCTGFARGLCFIDGYAAVGLSRLRPRNPDMPGINISRILQDRQTYQRCGLQIFDCDSGKIQHWVNIDGPITELYDIAFLAGIQTLYSPGFKEPTLHKRLMNLPANSLTANDKN